MPSIDELETRAKAHAAARTDLTNIVTLLNAELDAIKRKRMAKLKKSVADAAETGKALLDLVAESKTLFLKPKSVILYGIKCGFKKEKGKLDIADPEQTIKLIRKHFPELADNLIAKKEAPSKEGLNTCDAATLKKIGVTVTSDTEVAFISDPTSEVDKIVSALLKDAMEEVAE